MTTETEVLDLVGITQSDLLDKVQRAADEWRRRWDVIKGWRDIRYMRDDVRGLIPDELRTTDYEYHDSTFNKTCIELAAFLSAAEPVFMVNPSKDSERGKADDIEEIVQTIFESGGVLDTSGDAEVPFLVWQSQGENGHGIYKLTMTKEYPLGMPQRLYYDEFASGADIEENPGYKPNSRKAERAERGEGKYRETDESLRARRDEYASSAEFPFRRHYVDAATVFKIKMNDKTIAMGEISMRPATILSLHGGPAVTDKKRWVVYGEAHPENSRTAGGGRQEWVTCFELWTPNYGYWGFISNPSSRGERITMFAEGEDWRWVNPLRRLPYFEALGVPTTDDDTAMHLHGVFDGLIAETQLLNYLETLHFNAAHRQHLPQYQAIPDSNYAGEKVPLNAEQQRIVTSDELADVDLPPGWRWEPLSAGVEVNLFEQLKSSRDRIEKNALAAVLTGSSPGAGDSGAKISLLINSASRAMSPLVRSHEIPLAEMASAILDTAKRLKIPLSVASVRQGENGGRYVKRMELKPEAIFTTRVKCKLDVALPVDQAAMENRGLRLLEAQQMSYETVAPRYLGQNQPKKERDRITVDKFRPLIEQFAFSLAMKELVTFAPEIFADVAGQIMPPPAASDSAGGGPQGVYGGAAALAGTGQPALQGGQVDGMEGGVAGGGSFSNG